MSDYKYLASGRIVQVIATTQDGRFVVELGQEDEDGEVWFSSHDTEVVDKVFEKPPREAYHTDIAALEQQRTALVTAIRDLEKQQGDLARAHKERIAKLKSYEPLALIEDFLDGKLTHYVLIDDQYGKAAITVSTPQAQTETDDDRTYYKKLKLLWLFGDSEHRSVEWRLNRYSDGSGSYSSSKLVFPFTCEQDARAFAITKVANAFDLVRQKVQYYNATDAIASAKALGIAVPDDIAQIARERELKSARASVDEARAKLALAEKQLAGALGGVPA